MARSAPRWFYAGSDRHAFERIKANQRIEAPAKQERLRRQRHRPRRRRTLNSPQQFVKLFKKTNVLDELGDPLGLALPDLCCEKRTHLDNESALLSSWNDEKRNKKP